jgi:hypothetical protein
MLDRTLKALRSLGSANTMTVDMDGRWLVDVQLWIWVPRVCGEVFVELWSRTNI